MKDKLIPLKSELSIVKANETETLTELEEIDKSIQAFPKDPVQELLQSHAQYQHVCREIQQINESIHTEKTKLETELAHLGIGFSMEDIKDVQFPFHLEKTWEEIKNLSEKIALEKATATSERRKLNEQQTYLEEHIQQLQREMLTEDKRLALERTKQAYERKDMAKALLETGTKNKQAWLMQQRKQDRQAKIYAYSGFIAAIIFAIAAWWTKHFGYLAGMLASAFFGLSQWHWQKKKNKTVAEMFNDFGPSEANENTTEADYQSSKERLKQDDLTRQEADKLFEKMKDLDLQLLRVEAKMQEIKQQEEQLAANKQKQIGNYPFLQQVEIASWPRLFHLCTNLLRIRDEIIARETRKNKLETQNERFINKLHMFAQKNVGQYNSDTNAPSPDRLMEQINKQYQQYQTNKQRFADLKQSLEKTTTRKQELQEAIAVYNTELQQLYQTAEVEDEEAFYKMAEMKKLQQSLREQLQQIRVQFSIYFSDKEWQQLVNEQPKQSKLEWQSKQVDEKIEQLESSISENQKERAAIVTELAQMEHAKTHSELTHRFQMEQDKLAALAEKWAVLKLAKEMLEETKRDFRDKYITEVMRQTSAYFRELTGNKYHKVFAPADKQTFSVESADKITFAVNELSKGTVDQLYVSLRLAISKVISDENNMPFIIDDGFVHFDTRRNTRMMHLLQEISANRQIILFSCRKELAENVGVNNIIRLSNPVRIS
ncbi:hypothetical protein P5G51_013400 [Virgibacillus sp. 179-BFC.A HS]|uniref:Uncharacterized protein n=1 Tax=Tigheibacillus jepli TaxID=3035914 RepID=A0ABU5CL76_9BACI|nr:hypothetical protein [Virgibacillus sp. 179-BFC.A HS]MDY0406253.1 hypothetical protein [Virgibacillus sp. 179-BFC.A HS]